MNSFTFTPRLESLVDRLCLSVTGGELMLGDMPKTGEEAGLIGLLHSGEEVGAAVDYKAGESGWDVKPGEEVGAAVDLKTGESGWDVMPGEEQGAAVDYLLPAV